MDSEGQNLRSHLFLVRVWAGESAQAGSISAWHGRVQHITSSEAGYFHDWAGLITQLQSLLARLEVADPGGCDSSGPGSPAMPAMPPGETPAS
jgi:hypothetical protein